MEATHQKGMISKLSLMVSYIQDGYFVYNEVNNTGPIDFIIVHPETKDVQKIDAKTYSKRETGEQAGTMIHRILSKEQKDLGVKIVYWDEENKRRITVDKEEGPCG